MLASLCEGVVLHFPSLCMCRRATTQEAVTGIEAPNACILAGLAVGMAILAAVAAPLADAAVIDPSVRRLLRLRGGAVHDVGR